MKRKPKPAPGGEVIQFLDFPGPRVPAGKQVVKLIPIGDGESGPLVSERKAPQRQPKVISPKENADSTTNPTAKAPLPSQETKRRTLILTLFGDAVAMSGFTDEELSVWELVLFQSHSLTDAAMVLGISPVTCTERFISAVVKVKGVLKNDPAFQLLASMLRESTEVDIQTLE